MKMDKPDLIQIVFNAPRLAVGTARAGTEEQENASQRLLRAATYLKGLGDRPERAGLGRLTSFERLTNAMGIQIWSLYSPYQASWHNTKTDRFILEYSVRIAIVGTEDQAMVKGIAALFGLAGQQEAVGISWPGREPNFRGVSLQRNDNLKWTDNEIDEIANFCRDYRIGFETNAATNSIELWHYRKTEDYDWKNRVEELQERLDSSLTMAPICTTSIEAHKELLLHTDYEQALEEWLSNAIYERLFSR